VRSDCFFSLPSRAPTVRLVHQCMQWIALPPLVARLAPIQRPRHTHDARTPSGYAYNADRIPQGGTVCRLCTHTSRRYSTPASRIGCCRTSRTRIPSVQRCRWSIGQGLKEDGLEAVDRPVGAGGDGSFRPIPRVHVAAISAN
jgi:hypothetical protein